MAEEQPTVENQVLSQLAQMEKRLEAQIERMRESFRTVREEVQLNHRIESLERLQRGTLIATIVAWVILMLAVLGLYFRR